MTNSLINNTTCIEDDICNYLIQYLDILSNKFGITYGQLNIYLFCVYIPIMLILFMILSIKQNKKIAKILILINVILVIYLFINLPLI